MDSNAGMRLGVVISYYNPKGDAALRAQTELCALKALASADATLQVEVLVSDGTGQLDVDLEARLAARGIGYLVSKAPLGFAEGYNQGLRQLSAMVQPPHLVATCANDVFCDVPTLPLLAGALRTEPEVGCAIPYLTQSDYTLQNSWVYKKYRQADSMTLNLNVFRLADLSELGFIPTQFSGYFNDVALFIALAQQGKKVMIINGGNVVHFGRSTTSTSTQASLEVDKAMFQQAFAEYSDAKTGELQLEKLAVGGGQKAMRYLQARTSGRTRRVLAGLEVLGLQWEVFWHTAVLGNRL
jgi:GT2 family glycosyltransferase